MVCVMMWFRVATGRGEEMERFFQESYLPALRRQDGFRQSRLLRSFDSGFTSFALPSPLGDATFDYVVELTFETEERRRAWAATPEHGAFWPILRGLAEDARVLGFHVAVA